MLEWVLPSPEPSEMLFLRSRTLSMRSNLWSFSWNVEFTDHPLEFKKSVPSAYTRAGWDPIHNKKPMLNTFVFCILIFSYLLLSITIFSHRIVMNLTGCQQQLQMDNDQIIKWPIYQIISLAFFGNFTCHYEIINAWFLETGKLQLHNYLSLNERFASFYPVCSC